MRLAERQFVNWSEPAGRLTHRLLTALILLLMFGLALNSMVVKSPTFDEQGFLTRGLGYIRGENRHMRVGHPLGLNALNALLLRADDRIRLPVEHPTWAETSFHRPSEIFLWEMGNDVELVMFLARLPTIWLGLLLAATASRWAGQLSHRRPVALLALLFVALDPNILAHSRLTTTDLGLTMATTLSLYLLWRALRQPSLADDWPGRCRFRFAAKHEVYGWATCAFDGSSNPCGITRALATPGVPAPGFVAVYPHFSSGCFSHVMGQLWFPDRCAAGEWDDASVGRSNRASFSPSRPAA